MQHTARAEGDAPLVSVVLAVYNQRDYIEECLRSVAAQVTDFPIEVLVGDDCSTDGTQEVLERLRGELPQYFNIICRPENMGDLGERNNEDLMHRARGKYLAILEGDDFWTYEHKLQRQVEFLESHPDYMACYHHCTVVGADSRPNGEKYPECPVEEYDFREFFYCSLPGQLGTLLCRRAEFREVRDEFMAMKHYESYAGDRRNAFIMLSQGKIRCLPERWSCYRHVVKGGASFSANVQIDERYARNELQFGQTLIEFAELRHNAQALDAAKLTYYRTLLKWSVGKVKVARLGESLRQILREPGWPRYLTSPIRWYTVLASRMLRGKGVTL